MQLSRRSLTRLLAAIGLAPAAARAADEPFEVVLESNLGVATRDGVRLATDIYRPARGGKAVPGRFPVVLERTPYGDATSPASVTSPRPPTSRSPAPRSPSATSAMAMW